MGWVSTGGADDSRPAEDVLPCLGDLQSVERLVSTHAVDMVVVADLHGPREQMISLANLCEREMIQFKVIPSCFRVFVSGLTLETIAGTPVLGVTRLPLDDTLNVMAKRALDVVGASIGLLLSAPVVAIFSALVWLESPGGVFYRQRRWGFNGVPFDIIKIRSMKLNAEQDTGAQWCVKDDPRRLRIGAFMRKWNIDELPQFWNVLSGEMSLVGPRPERPELIEGFKHQIPHYNARHHSKPGMTGWAQVNGLRGDTDLGERIQCDLWYLENWSLWLDLQIMLLTFFKRDNAY
jgi:exopolysaccharide biosynthesis polyprenyl glycosylphosphotransferase